LLLKKGRRKGRGKEEYRSNVIKKITNIIHDPLDIPILLQKPMSLTIRHLANNIKRIELQPSGKVTALSRFSVQLGGLSEEELGGAVDEGLVLYQGTHGEGAVDAATKLGVEGFARGAEEGGETGSADDGLLDGVKFGLSPLLAFLLHFTLLSVTCFSHLRKALVQPINRLQCSRIREGQSVWTETDDVPMFSVE
jgi:hypothetical protein